MFWILFSVRNPLIGIFGRKYLILISIMFLMYCMTIRDIEINGILKYTSFAILLVFFLFEWYLYITQKILKH